MDIVVEKASAVDGESWGNSDTIYTFGQYLPSIELGCGKSEKDASLVTHMFRKPYQRNVASGSGVQSVFLNDKHTVRKLVNLGVECRLQGV